MSIAPDRPTPPNLLVPRYHVDDRRLGWFDVFEGKKIKNLNVVRIPNRGIICAWHRHQKQTDFWFVAQGSLQVGLATGTEPTKPEWVYLNPERGVTLVIPPPVWHGYKALQDNTILIYGLTEDYDGTDEDRYPVDVNVWKLGAR